MRLWKNTLFLFRKMVWERKAKKIVDVIDMATVVCAI